MSDSLTVEEERVMLLNARWTSRSRVERASKRLAMIGIDTGVFMSHERMGL